MIKIDELSSQSSQDLTRVERIGAHSHIHGLGLSQRLEPQVTAQGMVGQLRARKALGVVRELVHSNALGGRGIVIAGPPGSGKTALAMALSKDLGENAPFTSLSAAEVFSLEMSKTEALQQALRKSIGISIHEETDVLCGEVVEIALERPVVGSGIKVGKLIMKTTDMETIFDLGAKMIDALAKEDVSAGDVISIDKKTGRITKLGRSYGRMREFEVSGDQRYVKCPEGELQQRKESIHRVSLHDIDVINSGSQGFLALFTGDTGEISGEVRRQIDEKVIAWREEGKAEIMSGVLFIDEVHMLDTECFSFINNALEDPLAPVVIMASNRGVVRVRGAPPDEPPCPHGVPLDLLDRSLIIMTEPYTADELGQIIDLRCSEEGVTVDVPARSALILLGQQTSLRYVLHTITSSWLIAKRRKAVTVSVDDVKRSFTLFLDTKRSQQVLSAMKGEDSEDVQMKDAPGAQDD